MEENILNDSNYSAQPKADDQDQSAERSDNSPRTEPNEVIVEEKIDKKEESEIVDERKPEEAENKAEDESIIIEKQIADQREEDPSESIIEEKQAETKEEEQTNGDQIVADQKQEEEAEKVEQTDANKIEEDSIEKPNDQIEQNSATQMEVEETIEEISKEKTINRELFKNIRFYVINSDRESEVVSLLKEYGASQDKYLGSFITHVICDRIRLTSNQNEDDADENFESDYLEARDFDLPIIKVGKKRLFLYFF